MSKKKVTRGLGRGLDALLGGNLNTETKFDYQEKDKVRKEVEPLQDLPPNLSIGEINIKLIEVNPFQPRKDFNHEHLQELSNSISIHGVVQPVTVRAMGDGKYQLISGERRLRASKLAGLEQIPAYIRKADDQEMLEIALIENIQRENLNAIEVSLSYKRLLEECSLTHEELSERVGKERSSVTNFLRLLKLPPEIQLAVKKQDISMGHARALLSLEGDLIGQLRIFKEVINQKLSVRKTEQRVKAYKSTDDIGIAAKVNSLPSAYKRVQEELSEQFETKINIKLNPNSKKGEFKIPFVSESDFNRILDIFRNE